MIKLFEQYTRYNQIERWLDKMGIRSYKIKDDLHVDVNGNVMLRDKKLTSIPVKFDKVTGHFNCSSNLLTSLEGCPNYVGRSFECTGNMLTSLEYCPSIVEDGVFNCSYNKITSLKGCPNTIAYNFYARHNELTSLVGSPIELQRDFLVSDNYLTNLIGAPIKIGGDFDCTSNKLTSLIGYNKDVSRNLILHNNPLPDAIMDLYDDEFNALLDYQNDYMIWNSDGTFNEARFNILLSDFRNGIIE